MPRRTFTPQELEEYPAPSRMNYDPEGSSYTQSVKGSPFSSYTYGSRRENIEKSALLKAYEQIDPSMGKAINELTNRVAFGDLEKWYKYGHKDAAGVAADIYIQEMKNLGYAGGYKDGNLTPIGTGKGVRNAHKVTRMLPTSNRGTM
jgi:hypothetical protein